MRQFINNAQLIATALEIGQLAVTQGATLANDGGQSWYYITTGTAGVGDLTLNNGNIAKQEIFIGQEGVTEAPVDGQPYIRKDAGWVLGVAAAGGTFTGNVNLSKKTLQDVGSLQIRHVDGSTDGTILFTDNAGVPRANIRMDVSNFEDLVISQTEQGDIILVTSDIAKLIRANGYSIPTVTGGPIRLPSILGASNECVVTDGVGNWGYSLRLAHIVEDVSPQLGGNLDCLLVDINNAATVNVKATGPASNATVNFQNDGGTTVGRAGYDIINDDLVFRAVGAAKDVVINNAHVFIDGNTFTYPVAHGAAGTVITDVAGDGVLTMEPVAAGTTFMAGHWYNDNGVSNPNGGITTLGTMNTEFADGGIGSDMNASTGVFTVPANISRVRMDATVNVNHDTRGGWQAYISRDNSNDFGHHFTYIGQGGYDIASGNQNGVSVSTGWIAVGIGDTLQFKVMKDIADTLNTLSHNIAIEMRE